MQHEQANPCNNFGETEEVVEMATAVFPKACDGGQACVHAECRGPQGATLPCRTLCYCHQSPVLLGRLWCGSTVATNWQVCLLTKKYVCNM